MRVITGTVLAGREAWDVESTVAMSREVRRRMHLRNLDGKGRNWGRKRGRRAGRADKKCTRVKVRTKGDMEPVGKRLKEMDAMM